MGVGDRLSPSAELQDTLLLAAMTSTVILLAVLGSILAIEPNFEDIHEAADQPEGEVVDITQADPNSNTIHIAHNIPKDSDIKVVQSNSFNTTVHISMNVGTGSKVKVRMTNARNLQLHVSFNGMGNSECDVEIDTIFNSSVHLSFQNPKNTPVTLTMKNAELNNIHVAQNVPQRSPMTVTIDGAKTNQIVISQSAPMSSPLTWKLVGDPEENQFQVLQNAGDSSSPLDCDPECPQEEYVYDYAYADSASDHGPQDNQIQHLGPEKAAAVKSGAPSPRTEYVEYEDEYPGEEEEYQYPGEEEEDQYPAYTDTQELEGDYQVVEDYPEEDAPHEGFVVEEAEEAGVSEDFSCPGGDLQTCVDVCPGQYGANVFGACVLSCG